MSSEATEETHLSPWSQEPEGSQESLKPTSQKSNGGDTKSGWVGSVCNHSYGPFPILHIPEEQPEL